MRLNSIYEKNEDMKLLNKSIEFLIRCKLYYFLCLHFLVLLSDRRRDINIDCMSIWCTVVAVSLGHVDILQFCFNY